MDLVACKNTALEAAQLAAIELKNGWYSPKRVEHKEGFGKPSNITI
jgi:hypothetical protein